MGIFSTFGEAALTITGSQRGSEAAAKIIKGAFDVGVGVDNVVTNHKVISSEFSKSFFYQRICFQCIFVWKCCN